MNFPVVKKARNADENIVFPAHPVLEVYGEGAEEVRHWCNTFGLAYSEKGNITVFTKKVSERKMLRSEAGLFTDEKYVLELCVAPLPEIRVTYAFPRGLWHAMNTLGRLMKNGESQYKYIEDYPSFRKRGFIEGFYGKPWEEDERYSIMKLMSSYHMNTYFYAPKYDIYHRERWQDKYDDVSLEKLRSLVSHAERLRLDFYWCVAPGLTVQYSSEEQFFVLMDKIKQVYDIGVRHFGILLDDISPVLQYESDKIAFDGIEQAHICYVNNLYKALKELDAENTLTFCPFVYHGTATEKYIADVGSGLKEPIDIFWTGKNICSQELTCAEAVAFFDSTRHMPLYWDNFPVNDAEMANEMHLCPVIGRDAELYRYSEGLIANCMPYAECSKIPLMCIADYLWNPRAYDPSESFENACEELTGKGSFRELSYFTDNLFFSCLKDDNSVLMNKCLYAVEFAMRTGDRKKAALLLKTYIEKLTASVERLTPELKRELKFWIEKHELCVELLNVCHTFVANGGDVNKRKIPKALAAYNAHPARHADFCLQEFADFLCK